VHPGVFAAKEPERPAVIMGAAGPVVTYAELEARSNQVAWLARRAAGGPSATSATSIATATSTSPTGPAT
jgi:non-ribosomal peptide synthetase component F